MTGRFFSVGFALFLGVATFTAARGEQSIANVMATPSKTLFEIQNAKIPQTTAPFGEQGVSTLPRPSPVEQLVDDEAFKAADVFATRRNPTGKRVFIFDPNHGVWAIYDVKGNRLGVGKASGGKSYCADANKPCETIVGTFHVMSNGGPDCISHVYPLPHGGAPMPYCMLFDAKG